MPEDRKPHPSPSQGVMEGRGAYNRYARIQSAGGALALPLLQQAAGDIELGSDDRPIVLADYGCAQGKNSLAPMSAAIDAIRQQVGEARAILVCHVDQPSNDFNTLFGVLDGDPEHYAIDRPNVFPMAVGRSFYQTVLPKNYVNLGWSSYAALWLSRIPTTIPDHFWIPSSTGAVRAIFDQQARQDWGHFLSLRAAEMMPGARLVVVLPILANDGSSAFANLMNTGNAALAEMVAAGEIAAEERQRMVIGSFTRRMAEILAPFVDGSFEGLSVAQHETYEAPDLAWDDYERDRDVTALAAKRARFFRATFAPSLEGGLSEGRGVEDRRFFADKLEARMISHLSPQPAPLRHLVGAIVLAKQSSG